MTAHACSTSTRSVSTGGSSCASRVGRLRRHRTERGAVGRRGRNATGRRQLFEEKRLGLPSRAGLVADDLLTRYRRSRRRTESSQANRADGLERDRAVRPRAFSCRDPCQFCHRRASGRPTPGPGSPSRSTSSSSGCWSGSPIPGPRSAGTAWPSR